MLDNREVSKMMQKVKLFWEFYKSTLSMNLFSSVFLLFILFGAMQMVMKTSTPLILVYIHCCMFGGPFISFFYKELSRKKEYYFYYNRGITKVNLLVTTLLINFLFGILLINILRYAKLI
jgi:hypothetical protein